MLPVINRPDPLDARLGALVVAMARKGALTPPYPQSSSQGLI